ncbi:hypothetical protein BP6252_10411 [Coleophoma cylindrospora]|uniref:Uncharacterized protein n=1 Tax=Coleophoma cylindrospora TaxID=1849047 RepID=A0A3D8QSY8_9HELO|nr:hypothetical protein BP6252_10411 [Coleophoma cylindrospora]
MIPPKNAALCVYPNAAAAQSSDLARGRAALPPPAQDIPLADTDGEQHTHNLPMDSTRPKHNKSTPWNFTAEESNSITKSCEPCASPFRLPVKNPIPHAPQIPAFYPIPNDSSAKDGILGGGFCLNYMVEVLGKPEAGLWLELWTRGRVACARGV